MKGGSKKEERQCSGLHHMGTELCGLGDGLSFDTLSPEQPGEKPVSPLSSAVVLHSGDHLGPDTPSRCPPSAHREDTVAQAVAGEVESQGTVALN